jgi:hypothetical protein
MINFYMRFWIAARQLLLGLAILGFISAPIAASATNCGHAAVSAGGNDMHTPAMADMPCCPELPSQDCAKCISATACMTQCFQNLWHEEAFPPLSAASGGPMISWASALPSGLTATPPFKPPRA